MLKDVLPFEGIFPSSDSGGARARAAKAIAGFFRRKFGADITYDISQIPYGRHDLIDLYDTAERLKAVGVINSFSPRDGYADEPRMHQWSAQYGSAEHPQSAGGLSREGDREALVATLAEALERYLWSYEYDYFDSPTVASTSAMAHYGAINPSRFAGFSGEQREKSERLKIADNAEYLWVRGYSWTSRKRVWVPARAAFASARKHPLSQGRAEPLVIESITTGLATWHSRPGAVLRGALEIIERDAYMVMWLNQLSLPRMAPPSSESLEALLADCARYRLSVEFVRLITDAPAHVACAYVRDETGHAPRVVIGLKAHRDLAQACEGALLEALRARQNAHHRMAHPPKDWSADKPAGTLVHMERSLYWAEGDRYKKLEFIAAGALKAAPAGAWETDSDEEHLSRIVEWCRKSDYDLISLPLTRSKKNPTPWHIEMVVMPDLQPMHQREENIYLGGERLRSIPKIFGYEPRMNPFADEPHPFT